MVNVKAVQRLLPKEKKTQIIDDFKKGCSKSTTSIKLKEPMMEIPINQVLKTVLELMNEMPVEEDVSWRTINHLRQNYIRLNDKSK